MKDNVVSVTKIKRLAHQNKEGQWVPLSSSARREQRPAVKKGARGIYDRTTDCYTYAAADTCSVTGYVDSYVNKEGKKVEFFINEHEVQEKEFDEIIMKNKDGSTRAIYHLSK